MMSDTTRMRFDRWRNCWQQVQVVRPQNYFQPMPWHACLDTARTLLNRVSGGDWPGTIGVQRATLIATRGYDGDVLFENLELVRTISRERAARKPARSICTCDGCHLRRAISGRSACGRRTDEFARPWRLVFWLALLPLSIAAITFRGWSAIVAGVVLAIVAAETGRRRAGGTRVFPFVASLAAPAWICERAICAWLAVAAHALWGGIPYRGRIVARAATPLRQLQRRLGRA